MAIEDYAQYSQRVAQVIDEATHLKDSLVELSDAIDDGNDLAFQALCQCQTCVKTVTEILGVVLSILRVIQEG